MGPRGRPRSGEDEDREAGVYPHEWRRSGRRTSMRTMGVPPEMDVGSVPSCRPAAAGSEPSSPNDPAQRQGAESPHAGQEGLKGLPTIGLKMQQSEAGHYGGSDLDGGLESCLRSVLRADSAQRAVEAALCESRAAIEQAALASELCVTQARDERFFCDTSTGRPGELGVSVRDRVSGDCLAHWTLESDPLTESGEMAISSSVPLDIPGGECLTLIQRGDRATVTITVRCIPEGHTRSSGAAVAGTSQDDVGDEALGTWVIGDFSVRECLAAEAGPGIRVNIPEMAMQERRIQHFLSLADKLEGDLRRVDVQRQQLLDFMHISDEDNLASNLRSLNAEAGECLERLRNLHFQVLTASVGLDKC